VAIIAFVVIVVAIVVMVLIVAWGGFTFGARNGWFVLSMPHSRISNRRARPTIASLRRARLPRLIFATKAWAQSLCRYTIHADSTSRLRKSAGPRRVMWPKRTRSPLSSCLGTNPA